MSTAIYTLAKNLGAVYERNGRSDTGAFKTDAYDMLHADKTKRWPHLGKDCRHHTEQAKSSPQQIWKDMETPESILGAYSKRTKLFQFEDTDC